MKTFSYPQLFIALFALCVGHCLAQDANVIPFQGQLANQVGQVITPTNSFTLLFRLYTAPVGGIALWEESQPNISVNAGRFSVLLGSRTMLPAASIFNTTLYLGITVDDGNPQTADVEMRPRQALVPVISARYAHNADKLQGYDWSVLFGTNSPVDGKIQGAQIAPNSITARQVASNSITSAQIAANTITPENLIATLRTMINDMSPPGTTSAFSGTNVPNGWLVCDGAAVNRITYSNLFSALGTLYGSGDGSTTFNLPDYKGRVLVAFDAAQVEFNTLGKTGGKKSHTLTIAEMPAHSHAHNYSLVANGSASSIDQSGARWPSSANTQSAGGGLEHNNLQPYSTVNYIIKY